MKIERLKNYMHEVGEKNPASFWSQLAGTRVGGDPVWKGGHVQQWKAIKKKEDEEEQEENSMLYVDWIVLEHTTWLKPQLGSPPSGWLVLWGERNG